MRRLCFQKGDQVLRMVAGTRAGGAETAVFAAAFSRVVGGAGSKVERRSRKTFADSTARRVLAGGCGEDEQQSRSVGPGVTGAFRSLDAAQQSWDWR
jgi:hypothetical protein